MGAQAIKSFKHFEAVLVVLGLKQPAKTIGHFEAKASRLTPEQSSALFRLIFCLESICLTNQKSD